jgi:hypothetical protein
MFGSRWLLIRGSDVERAVTAKASSEAAGN